MLVDSGLEESVSYFEYNSYTAGHTFELLLPGNPGAALRIVWGSHGLKELSRGDNVGGLI